MTQTPNDPGSVSGNEDRLTDALLRFLTCMGAAVPDVCSYGLTIGEQYVPFDPDPEDDCELIEDEMPCEQLWVRVTGVAPEIKESFGGGACTATLNIGIEVGILRCFAARDNGEAPTATETMLAALKAMDDMQALYCGIMNCAVWDSVTVGEWHPEGPLGMQHGGTWSLTATLD